MTETKIEGVQDVKDTNPEQPTTEKTENIDNNNPETIDYKTKFSESSKEALRLLEENKAKEAELAAREAEIERLSKEIESKKDTSYSDGTELYPGFNYLSEEEKKNLMAYTDSVRQSALKEIYNDPAIASAKQSYNERVWDSALDEVVKTIPQLADPNERAEFKSKYFRADNVPANIKDILPDVAKIYLFDKAKDIGAQEALQREQERIDTERQQGGDNTPSASRSLEYWTNLAQSNPAEFAKRANEYNEDLKSGKLK